MNERKEETIVKIEKRTGSDAKASVTKDGKSGEASETNPDEAVSAAIDKAKNQTKATGGR